MNEKLKELAVQAGLEEFADGDWASLNWPDVRVEHLERFAELVRQDERTFIGHTIDVTDIVLRAKDEEREACAKLCDNEASQSGSDHEAGGMYWCAEAIRARG